jgi:para-nitrobenzyl esterase
MQKLRLILSGALTVLASFINGCFAPEKNVMADQDVPRTDGYTLTENVSVDQGKLRGIPRTNDGILAFKGIPYAESPVGSLRWKAPQPAPEWYGIREAAQFGDACLASISLPSSVARSEDCLTLNVWTPAQGSNENLPVMVWIHGGGFQFGSSAEEAYDGALLAAKGAVVVSINYRLGVLGFLALPALDDEGTASGNYGLLDQIMALKWVRTNIRNFGGDPNNVTLFGESAGAHSVGLLMSTSKARGLFHKAILQSGAWWDSEHGAITSREEARERGLMLSARLNVSSLEELRALPATEVMSAAPFNFSQDPGAEGFAPSRDGDLLTEEPGHTFSEGRQAPVPLLAGWNAAEHVLFMYRALQHGTAEEFRTALEQKFGENAATILELYPAESDEQATQSAMALIGDIVIAEQTWEAATQHLKLMHAPTWVYNFTYTSEYSPIAAHAVDPNFVFGTLPAITLIPGQRPPAGEDDHVFAEQLMTYWVQFAKVGDPNADGLPYWPRYYNAGEDIMELGRIIRPTSNPQAARFALLQSLREGGKWPVTWR